MLHVPATQLRSFEDELSNKFALAIPTTEQRFGHKTKAGNIILSGNLHQNRKCQGTKMIRVIKHLVEPLSEEVWCNELINLRNSRVQVEAP